MIVTTDCLSPIGPLTLAARENALIGLWMENQKHFAAGYGTAMVPRDNHPLFREARQWLDAYFAGDRPSVDALPLAPEGSDFRQRVWRILTQIPYGETVTYGEIAQQLGGTRMSAQAVGGAVGHNPISIMIPCHRVLGAGGKLTGYAGGVNRKLWLLRHEGVDSSRLILPTDSDL